MQVQIIFYNFVAEEVIVTYVTNLFSTLRKTLGE